MKTVDGLRLAFRAVQERRPELTDELVEESLASILRTLGGQKVFIPKSTRPRSLPPERVEAALAEAYVSGMPTEVAERNGISRSTLYRAMEKSTKSRTKG